MTNKNLFGFVSAAVIGMSLIASGCGTSGSKNPHNFNPVPPVETGATVTFLYNSVPDLGPERTDVSTNITKVKYNFINEQGITILATDEYALEHGSEAKEIDLAVEDDVLKDTFKVSAVYYSAEDEIVAFGTNDVAWRSVNGQARGYVDDPQICYVSENTKFEIAADKFVISPEESVKIGVALFNSEDEYALVTPFAKINGIDEEVLTAEEEAGVYTGAEYGVNEGISASIESGNGIIETAEDESITIYVTDQKVAGLELTSEHAEDGTVRMLSANHKLGQEAVVIDDIEYSVINTEELHASVVYTNEEGKGPQPEAQDVTEDCEFTIDTDGVTAEDGILDVSKIAESCAVSVKASYTAAEVEGAMEDQLIADVTKAEAKLALVYTNEAGETTTEVTLEDFDVNYDVTVKGVFTVDKESYIVSSEYIDIPEELIPETPAVLEVSEDIQDAVNVGFKEEATLEYTLQRIDEGEASGTISVDSFIEEIETTQSLTVNIPELI